MSPPLGVASGAVVESDRIGEQVSIGEYAIVREGAVLGDGVVIHPHAIIGEGVSLGEEVEVLPGAVLGKQPSLTGAISRRSDHVARAVRVASGCSIGVHALLYDNLSIGPDTLIGDGAQIREGCRVGARCILGRYATLAYEVTIGDGTRIMGQTHITGKSRLGRDVFVGQAVSSANDQTFGMADDLEDALQGPTIEDEAMVGSAAVLLPGVVIGRSATVGAGAVVTRDVEPETRVMGVPARPVQREPGA